MDSPEEKTSAAKLSRRWNDPELARPLLRDLKQFLKEGHLDHTLDLRGIDLLTSERLCEFNLMSGEFRDADISFGKGAISIHSAKVEKLLAQRFAFDRATYFCKCQVVDSDFAGARFKCDATDAEFTNCNFRNTVFKGGFNEYGFQRCIFRECNFEGIRWKNTYLRAVQFHRCEFKDAVLETSILVGVRFFGVSDWRSIVKDCEVTGIYVDGVRLELETPG